MIQEVLQTIILLTLIGFVTTRIAYQLGYFKKSTYSKPQVRFVNLLIVFAIYLGFLFVVPIILAILFNQLLVTHQLLLQFIAMVAMISLLLLYVQTDRFKVMTVALKNPESSSSVLKDIAIGIASWAVAYPWVTVMNQICSFFLKLVFNYEVTDQVAVRYLRENLDTKEKMFSALLTIVVVAPIVEEIIFRGTLQQWLKRFLPLKFAIGLSALAFSCFHFSSMQGLGNFALIPSLFVLACFLGYNYERQGSIYASVGLHITFNLISTLQILFFS